MAYVAANRGVACQCSLGNVQSGRDGCFRYDFLDSLSRVFFGWIFGDIIVLATMGTVLTVVLSPFIVKSKICPPIHLIGTLK